MPGSTLHLFLARLLGAASALLLAALVVGATSGIAHAEDGYRYWNYFHEKSGSWEFSQKGAADVTPKDGDIEGYRFGTSTISEGLEPRVDLAEVNFAAVCAEEEADAGEKRVGVLLDYGTAADAEGETPPEPRGACAVAKEDASGQQVLEAVADVRVEKSLTCAIDGYPVKGCGTPVADAEVAQNEQPVAFDLPSAADSEADAATDEDSAGGGLLWPLVGVALLVVVIGVAALVLGRRSRSA